MFMRFVQAQTDGFEGSFNAFLAEKGLDGDVIGTTATPVDPEFEPIEPKGAPRPEVMDAAAYNVHVVSPHFTVLGAQGEGHIAGVELLLACLEGVHVDNVRIEIEGGNEVRRTAVALMLCACAVHVDSSRIEVEGGGEVRCRVVQAVDVCVRALCMLTARASRSSNREVRRTAGQAFKVCAVHADSAHDAIPGSRAEESCSTPTVLRTAQKGGTTEVRGKSTSRMIHVSSRAAPNLHCRCGLEGLAQLHRTSDLPCMGSGADAGDLMEPPLLLRGRVHLQCEHRTSSTPSSFLRCRCSHRKPSLQRRARRE
jgi:hypothetical protein